MVCSPKGTNHTNKLLFGTSLYDLKVPEMPTASDLVMRDGLRLFSPPASLVAVAETFFARNPVESQVVLGSLADASDLLRLLLNGGNSTKAGYLAGALRQIGRGGLADEILSAMKSVGYDVRESNSFEAGQVLATPRRTVAPIAGRVQMMWESMRGAVVSIFPKAPGLPKQERAQIKELLARSIRGCNNAP